jgi:hypothetical protein
MSAPLRIENPQSQTRRASSVQPQEGFDAYLNRITKMIPTPVIGLYLVGSSQIPDGQALGLSVWAVVCLLGVIALMVYGTTDRQANKPPDWIHVVLSTFAFAIWVYVLGGPFEAYNLHIPWIGSLLVLAFTFFAPFVYRGATN